jgi:hypothetical protein
MTEYRALQSIAVAGEPHDEGDTFDATEEQMADAVAIGLVEEVGVDERKKATRAAAKKTS